MGDNDIEVAARQRLKNRLERLTRLAELNSPTFVMATEALMTLDALWLLDAYAVASAVASRELRRVKRGAGFCVVDDCQQHAEDGHDNCDDHERELMDVDDPVHFVATDDLRNSQVEVCGHKWPGSVTTDKDRVTCPACKESR